jgi:acyl-CoA synthetase (AMP-forming)/AMP-acid ligase II
VGEPAAAHHELVAPVLAMAETTSTEWDELGVSGIVEQPGLLDPDRAALIIADGVVAYGQLRVAVQQCAANLAAKGVGRGSVVAVIDDASLLSVASSLGLARIGAAAALINPRLRPGEVAALARVARCLDVAVAGKAYVRSTAEALGGQVLGEADLLVGVGEPARLDRPRPEDPALVLFTSGTTGLPKAVALTHQSLLPRIRTFAPPFDPAVTPSVSIMCVPLVHIGGMLGLMVALAPGNTTVIQARFDAGEWLSLVERHRVVRAFLVPTMLHRILEHPDFATADLSSLKAVAYGAAPAPPDLIARAVEALPGVAFSNVFGQTETLGSITALGPEDHGPAAPPGRLASVGRPMAGVEVMVVDPATGEEKPRGEVGELWAKTAPGEDWLRTGDLVWQDSDGYLFAVGRLSDTINRGGEKFAPAEVEAAIRAHPLVRDAAVAGIPDPEMGSRVGAAVVTTEPLSVDELRSFCAGRLASFKVPERVAFVEDLPYNDVGKVSRRELAALIAKATPSA